MIASPSSVRVDPLRRDLIRRQPLHKQWWLWTIVGVVAGGAIVTGAVLGARSHQTWNNVAEFGPGSSNGLLVR